MRIPLAAALALALLASARGAAAADVISPPTLILDWLYLGAPFGILAGTVLLAASIGVGGRLRRRGRSWPVSIGVGLGTFLAGDIAIYLLWLTFLRQPARRPDVGEAPRPEPARAAPAASAPPLDIRSQ